MLCVAGTDGYFKLLNPAWSRTLGWSADAMLARPFLELVHPDDTEATVYHTAAVAAGDTTLTFENRYRCADGSYKWLQWHAAASREEQRIYAVARDVTALKAAELERWAAYDEAERASRAKSMFLSRMSHDLRTPLNAILGFAQLLEMDAPQGDQARQVRHIIDAGQHLLQLINEILDIARVESGRLTLSVEPLAIGHLLQRATELIRPLAERQGISVAVTDVPADGYVLADAQRLMDVVTNLLSNAVKYNRPQGRVEIWCEAAAPASLRILVRDTGRGMRPDQLARAFDAFERLDAAHGAIEGTGLGLALAKGLIRAMRGRIGAESTPDQGSTFWIELPEGTPPAVSVQPERRTLANERRADITGTVLYIEDNASNVRLLEGVLARRPGIRLVVASDGATGLTHARRSRPDVILLDLHLPDCSGDEVLAQLQADATTRSIPVAVLTADATPTRRRPLLDGGAFAYLTKPLDVAEVLRLVDGACGRTSSGPATTYAERAG